MDVFFPWDRGGPTKTIHAKRTGAADSQVEGLTGEREMEKGDVNVIFFRGAVSIKIEWDRIPTDPAQKVAS